MAISKYPCTSSKFRSQTENTNHQPPNYQLLTSTYNLFKVTIPQSFNLTNPDAKANHSTISDPRP